MYCEEFRVAVGAEPMAMRTDIATHASQCVECADYRRRLQALDRRTSKLGGQGLYSGPIDNGQIELGADPVACAGQVAEWNGAGTSLGCVPAAP